MLLNISVNANLPVMHTEMNIQTMYHNYSNTGTNLYQSVSKLQVCSLCIHRARILSFTHHFPFISYYSAFLCFLTLFNLNSLKTSSTDILYLSFLLYYYLGYKTQSQKSKRGHVSDQHDLCPKLGNTGKGAKVNKFVRSPIENPSRWCFGC